MEPKTETIDTDIKQNLNDPDILQLCNIVPNEVLALPTGGKGVSVKLHLTLHSLTWVIACFVVYGE